MVECGFKVTKGSSAGSGQGPQIPFGPIPRSTSTSSTHIIDTLVQDQNLLKGEIFEVKQALVEEKAFNVKSHEDFLSAIFVLMAKFTSSSSSS